MEMNLKKNYVIAHVSCLDKHLCYEQLTGNTDLL